jgi:hypothetical protein
MISYAHELVELNFLPMDCTHFTETGVNLAFVSLMQGIKPCLTEGARGKFVRKAFPARSNLSVPTAP